MQHIGNGKVRKSFKFGLKASIAMTHKSVTLGWALSPSNTCDGQVLSALLEQTQHIPVKAIGRLPKELVVGLGLGYIDRDNPRSISLPATRTIV